LIPPRVKAHLGLDDQNSWIVVGEVNRFVWPSYDLREVPGQPGRFDYGYLPPRLFATVVSAIGTLYRKRLLAATSRD